MNEQNPSDDPVKSPEIQEIIMSYRIGIIAAELAKRLDISPVRALQRNHYELPHWNYCGRACQTFGHKSGTGFAIVL